MRFNDIDLQLVVAIARSSSITDAAEACFLAPSTASLRLRNLEDSLGVKLFERTAHGVFPTRAGAVMVDHAKRCIQALSTMRSALSTYRAGLQSSIQLCANWMALGPQLSKDIGAFLGEEPGARIHLHEAPDADIPLAVIEGAADLGITASRTELPELICLPYRPARFVLISPDSPDSRPPLRWPDALGQPMVTLRSALALHKQLHGEAARFGKRLDVRLEVDSHDSQIEMVSQGVGVGVLPAAALDGRSVAGLHLHAIPADWAHAMLYLCTSAQHDHPHLLARRLLDALHTAPLLQVPASAALSSQAARVFANPAP